MPLVCLGLSHHSAPVDVRERHAVPAARLAEALVALCDYETVREAVMVSTCNRMEIYAELTEYEDGLTQLKSFVQNFRHSAVADVHSYLYTHLGHSAAEHLYRVATGIDSMLIGEAEILGQLKLSYLSAQAAGTVGPMLHELFRGALQAGKKARTSTQIGEASLSVSTAAVELARKHLGSLDGIRAVVIGAGRMGQLAARRLHELGAREIVVANRTLQRAAEVVAAIGTGQATLLSELATSVAAADVIISAAGSTQFLLTPDLLRGARTAGAAAPLVIIDIAVPRDVDPELADEPGVQLFDIDALRDVVEDRLDRRRAAIPAVERVIAEQLQHFALWYRSRTALAPVARIAQHAEDVREREFARLFALCPELTARQRRLIIGASKRTLSHLFHAPFSQLRAVAALDLAAAQTLGRALATVFANAPLVQAATPPPVTLPTSRYSVPPSAPRLNV